MPDETRSLPPAPAETGSFTDEEGSKTVTRADGAPAPPADCPPPGIPGYEVLESVGVGGMGRVYRARQLATNRIVAVKLILAGEYAGTAARERFKSEVETTAKLSHPHVVQLYEAGEVDGRAFLSCEFVPGGSLADRLDGTPWEARRAAGLLVPLARAVAYAHACGVVHRDLKPSNVLLAADGAPKVADFGVAKRLDADSHTHTGVVLGTPSYMPPEQAGGAKAVGPAADVYALGAILYELLTGRPPFRGADFVETLDLVRTQEPVAPRALQPGVPRDLETICLKCLQKDPARRYPSAGALAEDLERFLEGRPIVARPVGGLERAWRSCLRNPALAGALAAVALALVTGTAVASYFAVQAEDRARAASDREREANDERLKADAARVRAEDLLYAAQISQANVAAVELRTERLHQLLADTRPEPGQTDRRGWEWHYLRRLSRGWEFERKLDFGGPAFASFDPARENLIWSFSADGRRALVYAVRFDVQPVPAPNYCTRAGLFDTATGRLIRECPGLKPTSGSTGLIIRVGPDAKFATVTEQYPRESGPKGGKPPTRDESRYRVRLVGLERGESEVLYRDLEHPAMAWVAAGGNRVVVAVDPNLTEDAFSGIGSYYSAAGASHDGRIEVWERGKQGSARAFIRPGGRNQNLSVKGVSPDATTAVIEYVAEPPPGSSERPYRIELWSVTGAPARLGVLHESPAVPDLPSVTEYSPEGRVVAALFGLGKSVALHDAATGNRIGGIALPGDRSSYFFRAQASEDGRRVVLESGSHAVVVERAVGAADGGASQGVVLPPTSTEGFFVSLGACGGRLLSGTFKGTLRGWDVSRLPGYETTWPERVRLGGEFAVPSLEAPRDVSRGSRVVYTPNTQFSQRQTKGVRVGVYDPRRRAIQAEFDVPAELDVTGGVSPDGGRILLHIANGNPLGVTDRRVRWSLRSVDDPVRELAGGPDGELAAFSGDGRWVVTYPYAPPFGRGEAPGSSVKVYRSADGRLMHEVRFDPTQTRICAGNALTRPVLVSPAGTLVVPTHPTIKRPQSGEMPGPVVITVRFYDVETGAARGSWSMPGHRPDIAFNDGTLAVSAPQPFFSPDGRRVGLCEAPGDGSVRAWALDGSTGAVLDEFAAPATTADRPPDGWGGYGGPTGTFGPGGRLAVWAGGDVVTWTGPGAAPVRLRGHEAGLAVAFASEGRRVFTLDGHGTTNDSTLRVWELPSGRELLALRLPAGLEMNRIGFLGDLWVEGEKVYVLTHTGVRVFDGTPLTE